MDPVDVITYFNEINKKYEERNSPFIYIDLIKNPETLTKLIYDIQIEVKDPFILYRKLFQWSIDEWRKPGRQRNNNINFVELKKILSDLNDEFMKHKDKLDNFFGSGDHGQNTNPFFDKKRSINNFF